MTRSFRNRSRLLVGCGSAALALALIIPQRAEAQAINASGNVTLGSATIDATVPGQTTVSVSTRTAAIDWTPAEDNAGNALDFLPTGTTATFQSSGGVTDFAVLNRILPSTNGNIVVMDGTVISRIIDATGNPAPGGFVAFYSPTGILIGSNATFDVGQLLLTTLDTSPTNFQAFVENNATLALTGQPGSIARVQIDPGAQITATPENSFFAVVAADIEMRGSAQINGSHAYVAGEVVNLSFSNGLFDITVPVGTAAGGQVLTIDGAVGGPSSNGAGDNHMIYAVAAAQNDPISMLLRGNLGFDPAQSAGIVNGEIILSANYNVSGRTVDGGSISNGIDAVFAGNSALSTVRADIFLEDFTATSSLLAIGTHAAQVAAAGGASSVAGNLLVVGREAASVSASNGQSLTVSGDVLVSAQDYGVVSSSLQTLDVINAQGGTASLEASGGGAITIGGNALVAADAFAGADDIARIAGTAQGGTALLGATAGTLDITGSARVSARGVGTTVQDILTGAAVRGGTAQVFVRQGGGVTLGGNLDLAADAVASQGSQFGPSSVSDAFGGAALITLFDGGGTLGVAGSASVVADARGGDSNGGGAGSIGDAGEAVANIDGAGIIDITGNLSLSAEGRGGTNVGGTGGLGLGGRASASTSLGGGIAVGGSFAATATGTGGIGQSGGDGLGGIAGANALTGTIAITLGANATADGNGGGAFFGFGGDGGSGRGGNAFFQANGTLTETASVIIGGDAFAYAQGVGGDGGQGDGQAIGPGRGGDAFGGEFTVSNQADPDFGGGAYLLAGGDNGTLSIAGFAFASASAFAGYGGSSGGNGVGLGGLGGEAFGGLAQVGLALLGLDGSVGQGSASFGNLFAEANAFGGSGGLTFDFSTGDGGDGTGGGAVLTVRAGTVSADQISLEASGFGGGGAQGGIGTGGTAAVFGSLDGSLTAGLLTIRALGFGGFGGIDAFTPGTAGDGIGGDAELDAQGLTIQVNGDVELDASGIGGNSNTVAANGLGGTARLGVLGAAPGGLTVTGNAAVAAHGFGGGADSGPGSAAGNGTGGTASLEAQGGGTVSLVTAQVMANGFGGEGEIPGFEAGDGAGGTAAIIATGAGSQLTIASNTTNALTNQENFGAILSASGVGSPATGGSGVGGSGSGGTITLRAAQGASLTLPLDSLGDPDSVGAIRLYATGIGGDSEVDGGSGGSGSGGIGLAEADGGTVLIGQTEFAVFGRGGSSLEPTRNIAGGNAFGGTRQIRVLNAGTLTLDQLAGAVGGFGGDGSGTGDGGDAVGGNNLVEVIGGTLNVIGTLSLTDDSTGGDGATGGDVFANGEAGLVGFTADQATINFTPVNGATGIVLGGVHQGGAGVSRGGNAQGAAVNLSINQTDISDALIEVNPIALGGDASAADGIGGDATGSAVTIGVTASQWTLAGETLFAADARGGAGGGSGGTGGSATSGTLDVVFTNSTLALVTDPNGVPGTLRLRSEADGGAGATVGNATSGRAALTLADSAMSGAQLSIEARGFADGNSAQQTGATASGGDAQLVLSGSSDLALDLIEILANAQTSNGGTALAGTASLAVTSGSTANVNATDITLVADASGADPFAQANVAGQFSVDVGGGSVNTTSLFVSALGSEANTDLAPSELIAVGGSLAIGGTLTAQAIDDILVRTGGGGIIGGPSLASPTADLLVTSEGTIRFEGDNDNAIGFGGASMRLAAREIDITQGARIGAGVVEITSLDTLNTAIIGGTTDEAGFTLTDAEAQRIDAGEFSFIAPSIASNDPNLPDILIRDVTAAGSLDDGTSTIRIFADPFDGIVRVEGTVTYGATAATDLLAISARRIEVVTPGGIRVQDLAGNPGGILSLDAGDIWVADAGTIAQLQADRAFAGRDALLAVALAGSDDPLGYLRGGTVDLAVGESLLVRNTGIAFEGGGILVGDGGLSIAAGTSGQQSGPGSTLDVFAYGRRRAPDGSFVLGAAFFDEVNFNRVAPGGTLYLDAAAFNDCIINTGVCPEPPPPPEPPTEVPPQINNPTVVVDPVTTGSEPPMSSEEEEERFGMDFPEQPDAPLISEDPLLDDPVTSGGDASLYSDGQTPPAGGKDK